MTQTILGSVGGAFGVAGHLGGVSGAELGHLARSAFIGGMDLGLATGAGVALAGCLIALIALPSRAPGDPKIPTASSSPESAGQQESRHDRSGPVAG